MSLPPLSPPPCESLTLSHSGRACAICIILLGSIWYTWIKHVESQQPQPAKQPGYEPVALDEMEQGKAKPAHENGHGHARRTSSARDARD